MKKTIITTIGAIHVTIAIVIIMATFCSFAEVNCSGMVEGKTYRLDRQNRRSDRYSERLPGPTRLPEIPEYIDGRPVKYQISYPLSRETEYPPNYLLMWTAKGCLPCVQVKIISEKLKEEGFDVFYLDFNKNQERAREDKIASLPTIVIYTDNDEVRRIIGINRKNKDDVEAEIREVLKKNREESNNYDIY